ncbi:MAG TPA: YidC/Oxa1 family membrane protein insertase [Candidatus Sulfotelmatobacter sp.]|nr:YidC/Oxa1 family membrane protein insertase [Candidatus Sulfotelmatobacter sp.]
MSLSSGQLPSRPGRRTVLIRAGLLLALLGLAVAMWLPVGTALADGPSPTASAPASTGATTTTPTPTPAGQTPFLENNEPPCPNITPAPTVSPTPSSAVAGSPIPTTTPLPSPTRHPNLCPAQLASIDPLTILAVAFTPIFQTIFLALAFIYSITGDIGIAIILVTLLIRLLLIPLFRRQITSTRRMQALQPELAEIRRRYKGDRNKQSAEQMKLYQDRGVNPAAGCLPSLAQMLLLLPMYYVFSAGLQAPNISSMLTVFGTKIVNIQCQDATGNALVPCLNSTIHWLGGLNAGQPAVFADIPLGFATFGLSLLALVSAGLQLIQTRMMMPPAVDSQSRSQQQIYAFIPLLSIVYGSFLPAGLFLYWIVTTVFSIVQQYLTVGWGSLFPLFGWTPAFAKGHTPRFGIAVAPPPRPRVTDTPAGQRDPRDAASGTVRPARKRARTSRRGRRR